MKKNEKRLLLILLIAVVAYYWFMIRKPGQEAEQINPTGETSQNDPVEILAAINKQVPKMAFADLPDYNNWGKDIFNYYDKQNLDKSSTKMDNSHEFILSGIMTAQNQRKAIINGELFTTGMKIKGYLIVAIEKESVVLSKNKELFTIKMEN